VHGKYNATLKVPGTEHATTTHSHFQPASHHNQQPGDVGDAWFMVSERTSAKKEMSTLHSLFTASTSPHSVTGHVSTVVQND
jgi:hypothetical protein